MLGIVIGKGRVWVPRKTIPEQLLDGAFAWFCHVLAGTALSCSKRWWESPTGLPCELTGSSYMLCVAASAALE